MKVFHFLDTDGTNLTDETVLQALLKLVRIKLIFFFICGICAIGVCIFSHLCNSYLSAKAGKSVASS
jgi:hypothetical protein